MKKLLDRTLKPLVSYALLVAVLSIPAYFLIIDFIWVRELDKHHYAIKRKLEGRINGLHLPDSTLWQTVAILNQTEPGFRLTPLAQPGSDSVYTLIRFDPFLQDREQFRCLITHIRIHHQPYRLLIETNMEEIDETILAIALVTLFFFVLLLTGFTWLNRRLSLRVWQPFYQTLQLLKTFRLHQGDMLAFAKSDVVEFEQLHESLRRLIEGNLTAYQKQKEFTENASHELQTPLAIVQSKLDLLLQNPELTASQGHQIEGITLALARVSRINKNLLLLARLENQQFPDHERVELSQVVSEQLDLMTGYLEERSQRVTMQLQPGIEVSANRSLIEILVINLLFNAARHTQDHGTIQVWLTDHRFAIANTGQQPLENDALFQRFSTASSQTPGSGLGLAIVKEICHRYRWQIAYSFQEGKHLFSLSF